MTEPYFNILPFIFTPNKPSQINTIDYVKISYFNFEHRQDTLLKLVTGAG